MGQSQDVLQCDRCCDASAPIMATVAQSKQALSNCDALANHDLLRYARQGHKEGVDDALRRGAWTETRRPWLVRPQESSGHRAPSPTAKASKNEGMTPLMYSSQIGSIEVVSRLTKARAWINAVEEDGWTPLHFAAKEQHSAICQKLLENRANHQLKNCDGETALTLARSVDESFVQEYHDLVAQFGFTDRSTSSNSGQVVTPQPVKTVNAELGINEASTVAEEPSSCCKSDDIVSPESTIKQQCAVKEDQCAVGKSTEISAPKSPKAGGC